MKPPQGHSTFSSQLFPVKGERGFRGSPPPRSLPSIPPAQETFVLCTAVLSGWWSDDPPWARGHKASKDNGVIPGMFGVTGSSAGICAQPHEQADVPNASSRLRLAGCSVIRPQLPASCMPPRGQAPLCLLLLGAPGTRWISVAP